MGQCWGLCNKSLNAQTNECKRGLLFTIALGVFLWGAGIDLGALPLGLGIFFMGFWTFIMAVNPELKDYGELRRKNR